MSAIVIDARMLRSSGIGTVITNVTRHLIAKNPTWRFMLLGDIAALRKMDWTDVGNVALTSFTAPLYSIREQLEFPLHETRDYRVLWSPNYNIPIRWRGRLAVTVHDIAHLMLPEMRRSLAKQMYARTMFAFTRRRADAIAFVSRFTMEEFRRHVGQPSGRQLICPGGVDESWFGPATSTEKPTRPFIIFVGNVKPHKNLTRLLEAYEKIWNEIPHDLMIVGQKDGFITEDPSIAQRVADFRGRVAFTGRVSDTRLHTLYRQADMLVLPSLYEGFGLPPLEAMAVGTPALVSRAASLPEVCGDAALYCDPVDTDNIAAMISRLLQDQELRQTLREKGIKRAREFGWSVSGKIYSDLFRDLAG